MAVRARSPSAPRWAPGGGGSSSSSSPKASCWAPLAAQPGLLVAFWCTRALVALGPTTIPRLSDVGIDWRVLGFTVATAVATSVLFGLAPAVASTGGVMARFVIGAGRGSIGSAGTRTRKTLVVAEMALAVVLLVGAGLLVRSYERIAGVNPGFSADACPHLPPRSARREIRRAQTRGGSSSPDSSIVCGRSVAWKACLPSWACRSTPTSTSARAFVGRVNPIRSDTPNCRDAHHHPRLFQDDEDPAARRAGVQRARRCHEPGGRDHQRAGGPPVLAGAEPDRPGDSSRRAALSRCAQWSEDDCRHHRRREIRQPRHARSRRGVPAVRAASGRRPDDRRPDGRRSARIRADRPCRSRRSSIASSRSPTFTR